MDYGIWLFLICVTSYAISARMRFYFHFAFFLGAIYINSVILLPFAIWYRKTPYIATQIGARMTWYIYKIMGIRWEFEGLENLGKGNKVGPFIVICNHQSCFDALTMLQLWPLLKRCRTVAKGELLKTGPFAWTLQLCGAIFIDRMSKEGNGKTVMNQAVIEAKNYDTSIFVFPEGTRNPDVNKHGLLPFKKGAFHIAFDAGMPILPIVISRYDFIDFKKKTFKLGGVVKFRIHEPIPTEGLDKAEHLNRILDETWNLMRKSFYEISSKMQ